jgi:AraC-like DNA-binding protein
MVAAPSIEEFLAAPTGRYVGGRTWISFCPHPRLAGLMLWGRPDEADARQFIRAIPVAGSPLADRRPRLVDVRHLDMPHPLAFAVLGEYVTKQRDLAATAIARAAVLRGPGMIGAVAAGFANVVPCSFPIRTFDDGCSALEWLGVPEDAPVLEEVDALQARAIGGTPVVRDLRRALEADLAVASLDTIARRLCLSARSLQRRLREEGTSFQHELGAARVGTAKRLLLESNVSIERISERVGYASVHHFGKLFRKATGASPRQWRTARKA